MTLGRSGHLKKVTTKNRAAVATSAVIEEEIKLQLPDRQIFQALKDDATINAHAVAHWQKQCCHTVYFDTSQKILLRNRLALRLRTIDSNSYWLGLKGFGAVVGGVAKRLEWEQCLTNPPENHYSGLHYSKLVSGPVKERLKGLLAKAALADDVVFHPLMATDIERQTCQIDIATGCRVEIALDWGVVRAAGAEQNLCEMEIEKISGTLQPMHALAAKLAKRYDLQPARFSKFAVGLLLLGVSKSELV